MACNSDCEKCTHRVECVISSCILFSIAFVVICMSILFNVPDEFRCEGKYYDIHPLWIEFVFVIGIIATSFAGAFLVCLISDAILNIRKIRMWINISKCKFNTKRTYNF